MGFDDDDVLPRKFGRTMLDARIGEGGMAEVFRARLIGQAFEKRVCVKRILPHLRRRKGFAEMFQDEARLLSGLQHPHIVQVFDFGDVDGALFLIMELVEGCALSDLNEHLSKQDKRLSIAQALKIGVALSGALHHAHTATRDGRPLGIVHRDVTPHNVLLGRDGAIKLTDFGVAHAVDRQARTETGALKGKLAYMSPEQAHGQDLDARSDQFAAGIVLWECLTGKRLFDGKSELNILEAVTQKVIPRVSALRPEVPPAVDNLIATMLQRDKRQRFKDMSVVEGELQTALVAALKKAGDDDLRPLIAEATSTPSLSPTKKSAVQPARIVTMPVHEEPKGIPVAIAGGVIAALVVVIGVGLALSSSSKPKKKAVADAGVAVVVLPPIPEVPVESAQTLPELPLPTLAKRVSSPALSFGGESPELILTRAGGKVREGAGVLFSTVVIAGNFDDVTEVNVEVKRRGTTRLIFRAPGRVELVLRRGEGAVVDHVVVVGNATVRVGDGGAAVDVVMLPPQDIDTSSLAAGGPAALRKAQSVAGFVDVVALVDAPANIVVGDGELGAGAITVLATAAERAGLRATWDRVIGHGPTCARRCEDLAREIMAPDHDRSMMSRDDVEAARQHVAPCIACLDAMGTQ